MKFENALQPDVKNLKNVFGKDFHGKTLLKVPRLVTSGYLMDDPEWSSNPHVHDFTELIFCTGGKGYTTIFDRDYEIEAGDLIIHNPATPHHEFSDPNRPLEFFFVGVTDFQVGGLPANCFMHENDCPVQKTGAYQEQFEVFFMELIKETLYRRVHYEQISNSICSCILALALRAMERGTGVEETVSHHSMRIKEYIDKNCTSDMNLAQLSSAVYISQTYLSHIFKAEMGVSPIQYLINKRIDYAKHLLANSDYSIAQIAAECGYDDPVYFSQVFKRLTTYSPKKFRADHHITDSQQ